MPRFHNINGEMVQFTADEETARDATIAPEGMTPLQCTKANEGNQ